MLCKVRGTLGCGTNSVHCSGTKTNLSPEYSGVIMVSGVRFHCFLQTQCCQHYTHIDRALSESSLQLQSTQTPYSFSMRLSQYLRGMRESRIFHIIRPSGLPFPPSTVILLEIAVRVRAAA